MMVCWLTCFVNLSPNSLGLYIFTIATGARANASNECSEVIPDFDAFALEVIPDFDAFALITVSLPQKTT